MRGVKQIAKQFIPGPVIKKYQNSKLQRILRAVPDLVGIENTNVCNGRCIMCPHSSDRNKRSPGFMDMSLAKRVLDECGELRVNKVSIGFFGEPLLDPLLLDKIYYAKEKNIPRVSTFTNAQTLEEEISRRLLESPLDKITISLDGLERDTFERVNVGLDFDRVKANIENFIGMRRSLKNNRLSVIICMTVVEENKHETDAYLDKYRRLLGREEGVVLLKAHNWGGQYKINDPYERKGRVPCHRPWTQLIFLIDGVAVLCCCDYNAKVVVGDITKQSIPEIWKGPVLKEIRKRHLAREFHKISICADCSENYSDINLKEI